MILVWVRLRDYPVRAFLRYSLFQIGSIVFFLSLMTAAAAGSTPTPYSWVSVCVFVSAAFSYIALLVSPQRKRIRRAAIILPLMAPASRLADYFLTPRPLSTYIIWCFILFVFAWVAPRFMPPPIGNGERKRYLLGAEAEGG